MFRSVRASYVAVGVALLLTLGVFGVAIAPDLRAQDNKMKSPAFQVLVVSNYDFNDTLDVLKAAIESQNLMVVSEINAQQMLRLVGVQTLGMRQILYFHPRYMKQLLELNKFATIEPPLKFGVMEMPNGKTAVRYIKPSSVFGRYEGLDAFGEEMDKLVQEIAASVQE